MCFLIQWHDKGTHYSVDEGIAIGGLLHMLAFYGMQYTIAARNERFNNNFCTLLKLQLNQQRRHRYSNQMTFTESVSYCVWLR
jgi:hypothetical protein